MGARGASPPGPPAFGGPAAPAVDRFRMEELRPERGEWGGEWSERRGGGAQPVSDGRVSTMARTQPSPATGAEVEEGSGGAPSADGRWLPAPPPRIAWCAAAEIVAPAGTRQRLFFWEGDEPLKNVKTQNPRNPLHGRREGCAQEKQAQGACGWRRNMQPGAL